MAAVYEGFCIGVPTVGKLPAPKRREERILHRVVEIVAHQLELAVDGVVDTNHVFTNVFRLA